nr:alpha/beta hydrolase [uncultured Pedobacter sp.]
MKKLVLLFLICFSLKGFSQQKQVINLWPSKSLQQPDEEFDTVKKVLKVTNVTTPLLKVYRPKMNGNGAAIIISPGGGNKFLAWNLEGTEIANWLNGLGYTAFILQYSVPNQQKKALNDIQRAIRLVRSKATDFKLDSSKIGVMGFSAGGNLSARASTDFHRKLENKIDAIDGFSCRPDFALLIYPGSMSTGTDRHLISEIPVDANTPPVFIFVASDDPYNIPFSMGMALRANKIPFEFHVTPKGGHGYGLRKGNPAAEVWPNLAQKWLQEILKN